MRKAFAVHRKGLVNGFHLLLTVKGLVFSTLGSTSPKPTSYFGFVLTRPLNPHRENHHGVPNT